MKITREMRTAINRRVRELCKASPLAEVGLRENADGHWVANALNWVEDADLGDLRRFALLREIDDCPDLSGCATLDLYVTSGIADRAGNGRELETNVYVTIAHGEVVDVHRDDAKADERCVRILGRPFSRTTCP